MTSASAKVIRNWLTAFCTTLGWSATCTISTPTGCSRSNRSTTLSTASPTVRMLAPRCITRPTASAGLPPWRTRKRGGSSKPRVTVATSAEAEAASARLDRGLGDGPHAVQRAGDAQGARAARRLDHAGRRHGVLPRQRIEQRLRRNAQGRELGVAELDEDALVLRAVDVDLGDVRDAQQLNLHRLGDALELREVGPIRLHHVEQAVDVAVLVVDARPDQRGRQVAAGCRRASWRIW